jgi:hypothetical protein
MIPQTLLSLRMTLPGPVSALPSSAAPDERVPCEGSGDDASAPQHTPRPDASQEAREMCYTRSGWGPT